MNSKLTLILNMIYLSISIALPFYTNNKWYVFVAGIVVSISLRTSIKIIVDIITDKQDRRRK